MMQSKKPYKWEKVFVSANLAKMNIILGKMQDEGIEAQLLNKKDSSYHFGVIELYVIAEQKIDAQGIIKNNFQ